MCLLCFSRWPKMYHLNTIKYRIIVKKKITDLEYSTWDMIETRLWRAFMWLLSGCECLSLCVCVWCAYKKNWNLKGFSVSYNKIRIVIWIKSSRPKRRICPKSTIFPKRKICFHFYSFEWCDICGIGYIDQSLFILYLCLIHWRYFIYVQWTSFIVAYITPSSHLG